MYFLKKVLRYLNQFLQYVVVVTLQSIVKLVFDSSSSKEDAEEKKRKVLVIRLDEIGDMVMMSPFLRELRRNYPIADITLIVKPEVQNLVEFCPYVDKVLSFSRKSGHLVFFLNLWRACTFSYRHLRKDYYDLVFVPRFDEDRSYGASLLAFFSRSAKRIGYSEYVLPHKMISDKGYDGFYTDVLLPEIGTVSHEVERNLDVLRFVGGTISNTELELWTTEEDVAHVEKILWKSEGNTVKRVAVVLTAGRKNKEWDTYSYIQVIRKIANRIPVQPLLLGAGDDAEKKGDFFCSHVPNSVNMINKTTLRESIEALKTCDCYLGGDTGLLHIAAALNMKGVALFVNRLEWRKDGIDTPERFGPWKSEMFILQPRAPLHGCELGCTRGEAHCIQQISIEAVEEQLMLLLQDVRQE